jgi:hypothetical protein
MCFLTCRTIFTCACLQEECTHFTIFSTLQIDLVLHSRKEDEDEHMSWSDVSGAVVSERVREESRVKGEESGGRSMSDSR